MTDNDKLKDEILSKYKWYDEDNYAQISFDDVVKAMEQYHLARLEAITDGEIAKTALKKIPINPVTFKDIPMSSSKRKGFEWGANWVLKKLKDNDLFK